MVALELIRDPLSLISWALSDLGLHSLSAELHETDFNKLSSLLTPENLFRMLRHFYRVCFCAVRLTAVNFTLLCFFFGHVRPMFSRNPTNELHVCKNIDVTRCGVSARQSTRKLKYSSGTKFSGMHHLWRKSRSCFYNSLSYPW